MKRKLIKDQDFSATKRRENSQKRSSLLRLLLFFAVIHLFPALAQAGFVTIGGTGVAADTTGFGGVNYSYKISQYEVTGAEFSTAIADDSRVGTYVSQTVNSPAEYIRWYEAAMYCNWLTSGDAYLGAYSFDGSGTFLGINRISAISTYGIVYALPTEDEWYKAAYWRNDINDQWSLYANGTDTTPTWGTIAGWNYRDATYGYATANQRPWEVGYGAQEQNGTYDMMGNILEWTENLYDSSRYASRGGSYFSSAGGLDSDSRGGGYPDREYSNSGFRIVMIPEPATVLLFFIGGIGAWLFRRNRIKSREDVE